nr:hypothetical protein Q903MT_gene5082 [Picea sitchensis]
MNKMMVSTNPLTIVSTNPHTIVKSGSATLNTLVTRLIFIYVITLFSNLLDSCSKTVPAT